MLCSHCQKNQAIEWWVYCNDCVKKMDAEGRCFHAGGGLKTHCFTCKAMNATTELLSSFCSTPLPFSTITSTITGPSITYQSPKKEVTTDGEEKRVFASGAQRGWAAGNGRFDLIPYSALLAMARRFELGVHKYGANNYKKGMPLGESYLNSAFRHLGKLMAGWEDEDHAGAVMFNIAAFIETRELIKQGKLPKELDDLPKSS